MNKDKVYAKVHEFCKSFPLASNWTLSEIFYEKTCRAGHPLFLLGLLAENTSNFLVSGSAAGYGSDETIIVRAYFELVERMVCFERIPPHEAPAERSPDWAYARSNGVAADINYQRACERAYEELVERDVILRSWYGDFSPQEVFDLDKNFDLYSKELFKLFDFKIVQFVDGDFFVAACLAFSKNDKSFDIQGFGCARTQKQSKEKAFKECLQRLAFLMGETFVSEISDLSFSPTPFYHQEFFAHPQSREILVRWMNGDHKKFKGSLYLSRDNPKHTSQPSFEDLTPEHLKDKMVVVRAHHQEKIPVVFGRNYPYLKPEYHKIIPIHPIA